MLTCVPIGGLDWGCTSGGYCKQFGQVDPGQEGLNQMKHFVKDTEINAFRIPVAWQYLVDGVLGGKLDPECFGNFDRQIQGYLGAGVALYITEVHKHARWKISIGGTEGIIGQGSPSDAQFMNPLAQLATKYQNTPKVAFGPVNEPTSRSCSTHRADHYDWFDLSMISISGAGQRPVRPRHRLCICGLVSLRWIGRVNVGCQEPGRLDKVEVQKYLDLDNLGGQNTCSRNNTEVFRELGIWLGEKKRKAFLADTGGGPFDKGCRKLLCEQLDVLNAYSNVYLGWLGWAAGMFEYEITLAETPKKVDGGYHDVPLVKECIAGKFK